MAGISNITKSDFFIIASLCLFGEYMVFGFGKGKIEMTLNKYGFGFGETISGNVNLQLKKTIQARGLYALAG